MSAAIRQGEASMANRTGRPNVVVFFTDQQRWDSTGVHGNPLELTPNFDRMATRGTHLYNAFTCQPVCGPARASLQTGMYATATGVWRNSIRLPANLKTLGQCFRDGGYKTGYIGKWHLGSQTVVPEEERGGYEYWLGANCTEFTSEAYHTVYYDNDNKPVRLPGYRVDATTDAAIRYIDGHKDEPFFLFTSFIEPHFQNRLDSYPAPDGYEQRYQGRWVPPDLAALGGSTHQHLGGYWGMCKRLDEALGRLMDALRSLDILDNTIVLFTTDHGCHFKTRNSEYKRSCHESSIRIPTALSGPGFEGGGQVRQMVSLVDLPATLLDAAGLPIPAQMQGRSVVPLLRRQRDGWPDDVFVQISEAQVGRAVRTQRWTYSVSAPDKQGGKDPSSDTYVEEFLYDNEADPYQLNNLIGLTSHEEVTRVMRERLLRHIGKVEDCQPTIEAAPSRPGGQKKVYEEEVGQ
jgi:arylsulfatase A-like enzyme